MNTAILGSIPLLPLRDIVHPVDDGTDLIAWRQTRDEAAFARLVERHAGLVAAVCRRQLESWSDPDEATQAVFLILARRAGEISPPGQLASWLYGVAVNVCRNARRAAVSRQQHEREAGRVLAEARSDTGGEGSEWRTLRAHLDTALSSLNQGQRDAVIGHYLEGLPQAAVAVRLGISEDAAKKRIHYAIDKLRSWFGQRGIAVTAVALCAGLASESAAAEPILVATCTKAALQPSLASSGVTALASSSVGAISAVSIAVIAAVLTLLIGGGLVAGMMWTSSDPPPAVVAADPPNPPNTVDPVLQQILDRRITVRFKRSYVGEALSVLRKQTGLRSAFPPPLNKRIAYTRTGEVTVREVLADVTRLGGFTLSYHEKKVVIWGVADATAVGRTIQQFQQGSLTERVAGLYALARICDPQSCAALLGALSDPEPLIANGALGTLVGWPIADQDIIPVPTQWLVNRIRAGVGGAAVLAGHCDDPDTYAALEAALDDGQKDFRYCAVVGLCWRGDPRAIEPLRQLRGRSTDAMEKHWIYRGLRSLENGGMDSEIVGDAAYAEQLTLRAVQLLDQDPKIRHQVVNQCWEGCEDVFRDRLSVMSRQDADPGVRCAAITALAQLRDESVFSDLKLLTQDKDPDIRCWAARAIGQAGFTQSFDVMHPMLTDSSQSVRKEAAEAMSRSTDPRALDVLITMLNTVQDEPVTSPGASTIVQIRASESLRDMRDPRAISALVEIARAKTPACVTGQRAALWALHCHDNVAHDNAATSANDF